MHGKTILIFSRIWNYDEASLLNMFDNQDGPNRGIFKLYLVNEFDHTTCFLFLQVSSVAGMFSGLLCSNVVFQMLVQMDDAYAKVIEFPGDGSGSCLERLHSTR